MIYFVLPRFCKWSRLQLFGEIPIAALCEMADGKSEDGAIGFLAVYETLEEFKAQHPDIEPLTIRVTEVAK